LTFVLGGAPTGVELAASITQMVAVTLRSNFRRIGPRAYYPSLSMKAAKRLEKLGIKGGSQIGWNGFVRWPKGSGFGRI